MPDSVDFEAAALRAIELGLRGDVHSLRQYARQLLKRTRDEKSSFRQELSRLYAESGSGEASFRASSTSSSTVLGDAESFVRFEQPDRIRRPVLPDELEQQLDEVLSERRAASKLYDAGLSPTRSLLLVGPPGVGKTMTARFLAAEASVPLFSVDLSAVMSRFLGRTGQNVRSALEQARLTPSVCLLDEFDALGKKRDDPTDVGELKRIVTVVLHELETWPDHGLFVAATNHPELLDRAVWRRFDRVLTLPMPDAGERRRIISQEMDGHGFSVGDDILSVTAQLTDGWSGSDLARIVRAVVRGRILNRWNDLEAGLVDLLLRDIAQKHGSEADPRRVFVEVAVKKVGLSQRATGRLLGVSHVTIGTILRSELPVTTRQLSS